MFRKHEQARPIFDRAFLCLVTVYFEMIANSIPEVRQID